MLAILAWCSIAKSNRAVVLPCLITWIDSIVLERILQSGKWGRRTRLRILLFFVIVIVFAKGHVSVAVFRSDSVKKSPGKAATGCTGSGDIAALSNSVEEPPS